MAHIDSRLADIGRMDTLAALDTPVHRIDPRAKIVTTLVFILCVLSFGKYEVAALAPFFAYPAMLMALGGIPAGLLLRQLAMAAPFAVLVGMFNPLLDRHVVAALGPWEITGGWLSFLSILLRFALTVGTSLLVIAVTGIHGLCRGLDRLGVPPAFTVQLLFLYRYLFVLMDEGSRMVRARSLRSFDGRGSGLRVYGSMLGSLLLRTLARAQRIHLAMTCRGFDGHVRTPGQLRFGMSDALFVAGWTAAFALMRAYNLPQMLGVMVTEATR